MLAQSQEALPIPKEISEKLYPHQRTGIQWLYNLHSSPIGGLLGDDMGLGKTVQVVVYLSTILSSCLIKNALIIVPASVTESWMKTFNEWSPSVHAKTYCSKMNKNKGRLLVSNINQGGDVLIVSYSLFLHRREDFNGSWDYLVLDEGHLIKNYRSKTSQAVRGINARHRILLTGTPMQNNYDEFWSLIEFIAPGGTLLGTASQFKAKFSAPIIRALKSTTDSHFVVQAEKALNELHEKVRPYLLRRTKNILFNQLNKKELVVWLRLQPEQEQVYGELARMVHIDSKKDILKYINKLRLTCTLKDMGERAASELSLVSDVMQLSHGSSKLQFVMQLLDFFHRNGNKCVVFTDTLITLNVLAALLNDRSYSYIRMDGSVSDRQSIINRFNNSDVFVFMSTVRSGGVGITLTGADRVIVMDPSWNPTIDDQAVDRVFRLGQTRDVVTFRLITCGTVEEKLYKMQILKTSMQHSVLQGYTKTPFFTLDQVKELFAFTTSNHSVTCDSLSGMIDRSLNELVEQIQHFNFVYGLTMHHMMMKEDGPLFAIEEEEAEVDDEQFQLSNPPEYICISDSDSFHTARSSIQVNDVIEVNSVDSFVVDDDYGFNENDELSMGNLVIDSDDDSVNQVIDSEDDSDEGSANQVIDSDEGSVNQVIDSVPFIDSDAISLNTNQLFNENSIELVQSESESDNVLHKNYRPSRIIIESDDDEDLIEKLDSIQISKVTLVNSLINKCQYEQAMELLSEMIQEEESDESVIGKFTELALKMKIIN